MNAKNLSLSILLIFLIAGAGMWGCKKDPEEPFVLKIETLGVSKVSSAGATFEASIVVKGDVNISEYGFLWAEHKPDWETHAQKVAFQGAPPAELISITMERDLEPGKTYVVSAYVIMGGARTRGNFVLFESLGSKGPRYLKLLPRQGALGRYHCNLWTLFWRRCIKDRCENGRSNSSPYISF